MCQNLGNNIIHKKKNQLPNVIQNKSNNLTKYHSFSDG